MVTKNLSRAGWILAFLTLAAMIIFAIIGAADKDETVPDYDWICDLLDAPIIFIILIGLVCRNDIGLAKTLSLARSANNFMKDHVYLRKLEAVETMAYCNEIVTDKTGILT